MGHGGHSIVARGLYCLQIRPFLEAFEEDQLKVKHGNLYFNFFQRVDVEYVMTSRK